MKFTARQMALILETPLGDFYGRYDHDPVVKAERKKIQDRYNELNCQLGFDESSLQARAEWLDNTACHSV